jgi:hypothetical protein
MYRVEGQAIQANKQRGSNQTLLFVAWRLLSLLFDSDDVPPDTGYLWGVTNKKVEI